MKKIKTILISAILALSLTAAYSWPCGYATVYGGGGAWIQVGLNSAAYGCQAYAYFPEGYSQCYIATQN